MTTYRWKQGRAESPVKGIEPRDYEADELKAALGEVVDCWGGNVERALQYVSQFFDIIETGNDDEPDEDTTPLGGTE